MADPSPHEHAPPGGIQPSHHDTTMSTGEGAPASQGLSKARIEALTDGIFAVAMTLLVLDIKVPVVQVAAELPHRLLTLWPQCLSYLISFIMLGIYWVGQHNQFHLIRRTDRVLLWINILFMLVISFVPFSTALLSAYPRQPVALMIYGANLIVIGAILSWHWRYATRRHRLVDASLDPRIVRLAARRILIGPTLFLIAVGVALFSTTTSLIIYLLAPLVYILPGKVDRHWSIWGASHQADASPASAAPRRPIR